MRRVLTLAVRRALAAIGGSLAVQLTIALALLVFLPVLVLGGLALQSISGASRETAARSHTATASAAASALGAFVEAAAQDLVVFGSSLSEPLDRTLDPRLRRFVVDHPHFRRVTIVTGQDVRSTSALVNPPSVLQPRPAVGQIGRVTLTATSPDDDLLQTAELVIPVLPTGTLLVADLRLEHLWRVVGALELPPRAQAFLTDRSGMVLAHSNPAYYGDVTRGIPLRAHPLLRRGAGQVTTYSTPDGVEWLASAAPLARLGWTLVIEQPSIVVDEPATTARRQLIAVLLLAASGVALALAFAARRMTAPLRALTRATHALARGEAVVGVPVPRHQQMADLARAFNTLLEARTTLEATVRRQERDAVIGQISGGLVHDLAHPIANIVNSARLLPRVTAEARQTCLDLIEREHTIVVELFEHLREFGRSTTVPLSTQTVVPHHVVHEIAALLRPDADARGVTLHVAAAEEVAPIQTDRVAIGRVLRNLTLNGIEAADATHGTVTLSVEDVGDDVCFTIRDTGPGLAPDRLDTLFDPWRSTKRKGLGLGLATAKRVVEEQMGGRLTATSTVGVGTCCVVALPRRRVSVELGR